VHTAIRSAATGKRVAFERRRAEEEALIQVAVASRTESDASNVMSTWDLGFRV
jgi:hypothetical protein